VAATRAATVGGNGVAVVATAAGVAVAGAEVAVGVVGGKGVRQLAHCRHVSLTCVWQCGAVCCSVFQCVAARLGVFHYVAATCTLSPYFSHLCFAVCCSMLQRASL